MKKRIKLQTCFSLPGSDSDMMDLPNGVITIKDLLHHMEKALKFNLIDSNSGDLDKDIDIILNGKEVWFYPYKLNHPLCDGDTLEIYLLPLGGG